MGWTIDSRWPYLSSGVGPDDLSHSVIILICFYINSQQRTQDSAMRTLDLGSWQTAHFTGPTQLGHKILIVRTANHFHHSYSPKSARSAWQQGNRTPCIGCSGAHQAGVSCGVEVSPPPLKVLQCLERNCSFDLSLDISTDKIWWTWNFLSLIYGWRDASSAFTLALFSHKFHYLRKGN